MGTNKATHAILLQRYLKLNSKTGRSEMLDLTLGEPLDITGIFEFRKSVYAAYSQYL